jgi:hypothetical protein
MAGYAPSLLNLEQDHVGVAINPQTKNSLRMPALFALAP